VWLDGWILKIIDIKPETPPGTALSADSRLFRSQLVVMNEADLHGHLVAETRKTWPSAVLVPGIGELPEAGDRRLQAWRMGYTKGQPDLMILNPSRDHYGLAIEFYHPGFEPVPGNEQLAFRTCLRTLGWKVVVCNDFAAGVREIDAHMQLCKVTCDCCGRLFPSKKHIDAHLLRKRKYEEAEDAEATSEPAL